MSEISIKIKIAERTYPMRVKQEDEARIREASRLINERITKYMNKFGIGDKQDLLAMVAFDCLIESTSTGNERINHDFIDRLNFLCDRISDAVD